MDSSVRRELINSSSFSSIFNLRSDPLHEKAFFLSDLLAGICWSVCILKSQGILCLSFSKPHPDLYIHHLSAWSNFYLLHNSQWIIVFTRSYLLILRLVASSQSSHKVSKVADRSRGLPESYDTEMREERYSFPWIVPLYPWYVPYNAEC